MLLQLRSYHIHHIHNHLKNENKYNQIIFNKKSKVQAFTWDPLLLTYYIVCKSKRCEAPQVPMDGRWLNYYHSCIEKTTVQLWKWEQDSVYTCLWSYCTDHSEQSKVEEIFHFSSTGRKQGPIWLSVSSLYSHSSIIYLRFYHPSSMVLPIYLPTCYLSSVYHQSTSLSLSAYISKINSVSTVHSVCPRTPTGRGLEGSGGRRKSLLHIPCFLIWLWNHANISRPYKTQLTLKSNF